MEKLNINDIKKVIVETFNSFEIPCYIQRSKETLFRFCFDVILKDSKYLTQVNKALKVLRVNLHNENISLIESDYKLSSSKQLPICIEIKKLQIEDVSFYDVKDMKEENRLSVLCATDENYNAVYHDFEKEGNLLIVSDDKIGSDNLLNSIIQSLCLKNKEKEIEIYLADLTNGFERWKNKNNILEISSGKSFEAMKLIQEVADKIPERKPRKEIVPKVLIVRDYNHLISDWAKKYIVGDITDIINRGQKFGFYLVLETQKVGVSVMDPLLLNTFNKRICFKVKSSTESMNVLGNRDACKILSEGQAFIKDCEMNSLRLVKALNIDCERKGKCYIGNDQSKTNGILNDEYFEKISIALETLKGDELIQTVVTNFIEKNGRMQYLDLFLANKQSVSILVNHSIYQKIWFTRMVRNSVKLLQNGVNLFDECQRIKAMDLKDVGGNESILIDKSTYLNFNEIKYLYNILLEQNILKIGEIQKDAFFMLIYEKYYEYLKNLFTELTNKYNIELKDDNLIIENMLNSGKGVEEVKNYIALKNFIEQDEMLIDYDLCLEQLGTKVEDKYKDLKQKQYINNLLNLNKNHSSKTLHEIDLMSGQEFEHFVADLFRKMGYEAQVTKTSGDQGVDVVAKRNDITIAIQAKCYSNVVGNHAIMEAVAGSKYYKANKCIVVTNSTFTTSAKELAKANNVELWDRQVLKEKMEEI